MQITSIDDLHEIVEIQKSLNGGHTSQTQMDKCEDCVWSK